MLFLTSKIKRGKGEGMKGIFTTSLVFIIMVNTAIAQEQRDRLYIKTGIGVASGIDNNGAFNEINDQKEEFNFVFDESAAFQLGVGYLINDWFTTELYLHHNSDFTLEGPFVFNGVTTGLIGKTDLETTSVMLTGQIDMASILKKSWKTRPYVGLGVGYTENKVGKIEFRGYPNIYINKNTSSSFAWKATFGAIYPINEQLIFDASYSYSDYGKAKSSKYATDGFDVVKLESPLTFDVKTHEFMISLNYIF